MTKNCLFLRFTIVFMRYCPRFWGSKAIYDNRNTRYMFESYDQKLFVFAFYDHFHELLRIVLGVPVTFTTTVRPDTCLRVMTKNSLFSLFMVVFMSYFPRFWGTRAIYDHRKTRSHVWDLWPKTVCFCVLSSFSWAIAHNFVAPGQFAWPVRLDICLRDMTKNLSISRLTTLFMSYYLRFCGSRDIYNDRKIWYMFESYDQKLVVFSSYGHFV